jgi:hypothetical protein
MDAQFDAVIRGGMIADGTGAPLSDADIAITGGTITAVGKFPGHGAREIDAKGHLVTPGFVDIHTHYDGQATWDSRMQPSSWHGVTTTVMGNCGVGFAPVRPADHNRLIELMEGVEDIPGAALHEASPGIGKASHPIWTRWIAARATSISAPSFRTARCACSSWANAAPTWKRPPRAISPRCAAWPPMPCAPARSAFPPRAP